MVELSIIWLEGIFKVNYPQIISRWVFPLVTAMLSLGLPLLLNTIQRIESNYRAQGISSLLMRTSWAWMYVSSIIATVAFVIIYLLQLPRTVDINEWCNALIDNSAAILLVLSSTLLLISMLGVAYTIYKYTTNTSGMYKLGKKGLIAYFEESNRAGKQYKGLVYFWAITEVAIKEVDSNLFDEILNDYKKCIRLYRDAAFQSQQEEKDHLPIEYPNSLLQGLYQLSQRCLTAGCEITVQERVYHMVCETMFEVPFTTRNRPKVGLCEKSIIALWDILMLAAKQKCAEYMKLYWATIFEYATMLYHGRFYPDVQLTETAFDKKKFLLERDLITFSHFIWQAYLYERKEYELLRFALEYYNLGADVVELDYHFSGNAVGVYLSIESYMPNIDAGSRISGPDAIVQAFPCFEIRSNSAISQQYLMLANYTSFIIHKDYNLYGGVPYFDFKNACTDRIRTVSSLRWALRNQKKGEPIAISGTTIEKVMNENEVESMMWCVGKKDEQGEKEFIANTPVRKDIIDNVWKQVYGDLAFEIPKSNHLWTLHLEASAPKKDVDVQTIAASILKQKQYFIYTMNQVVYYSYGEELGSAFMRKIDEAVAVVLGGMKDDVSVQKMYEYNAAQHLTRQNDDERCVLFYASEKTNYPAELAEKWGGVYEPQRGFISAKYAGSKLVIKCIPINPKDKRVKHLIGQLWIMPMNELPKISFANHDVQENVKRLGDYYPLPMATSQEKRAFNELPLYCENEAIVIGDGLHAVKMQLSAAIQVNVSSVLHARVIRLIVRKKTAKTEEECQEIKQEKDKSCAWKWVSWIKEKFSKLVNKLLYE